MSEHQNSWYSSHLISISEIWCFIVYLGIAQMTLVIRAFAFPCFRISAVLFQYHEHQYPIRGYGRSCRAGPLSCSRSFTDSSHHMDSGDYKLRPLMVYDSENTRACYTFPVLRIFDIRGHSQESKTRV
jgi:hypothetical protein